jgi:NAD-dependent dihydropyrimidine dehydrogenase PreA subunit
MNSKLQNVGAIQIPHPIIHEDECKACGRCVAACPKKVLRISTRFNNKGMTPVEYIGEGCIGCGICFYNCPEPYALEVQKK